MISLIVNIKLVNLTLLSYIVLILIKLLISPHHKLPPLDLSNKQIYISAFQYSESQKNDIEMLVQSNENTKCLENCSGNGECYDNGCHCLIGFAGLSCEATLMLVCKKSFEITMEGYNWAFFYNDIFDEDEVDINMFTEDRLNIYSDMQNFTGVMPFFSHSSKDFSIRPEKNEEIEKYVLEIETEGQCFKYLLWSLHYNQPDSCRIKISLRKLINQQRK